MGPNSIVLWSLIGATYMDITVRLSRHVGRSITNPEEEEKAGTVEFGTTDSNRFIGTLAVLPLGATAFIFKLAFTAKDAPEFTRGISDGLIEWVLGLELVSVARMVFGGIALSSAWIIFSERSRSNTRLKKGGTGTGGEYTALPIY
jgi:ethanolamine phosphate transferase 2 subunit G